MDKALEAWWSQYHGWHFTHPKCHAHTDPPEKCKARNK